MRCLRTPCVNKNYHFYINESLPIRATHLLVFTRNDSGQMSVGTSYKILDEKKSLSKATLILKISPSEEGILKGEDKPNKYGEIDDFKGDYKEKVSVVENDKNKD